LDLEAWRECHDFHDIRRRNDVGATPPSDLLLLTAGAEWRLRQGWSFLAKFDGEFGDRSQTYTGTARARYTW